MAKLSLGLGLGVGYVLGARAGRARYEEIKKAAAGFLQRPDVQEALGKARASAPAPLQQGIDKLTASGSGGSATGNAATSTRTTGAGPTGDRDAPLPDPLIPPAKSG